MNAVLRLSVAPITTELRRVLDVAAALTEPLTPRQQAAFSFLYCWLRVSMRHGRLSYTDFRIQRARTRYLHAATNRCGIL